MDDEQVRSGLAESWTLVREQRKRMQAQVVQLSALEVAEFTHAARHIVEVAEELQAIAKYDHLPRLEDEARRFAWSAARAAEAAEQLRLSLAREELAPPASVELLPVAPEATAPKVMATQSGVEAILGQMDNAGNGRVVKQKAK